MPFKMTRAQTLEAIREGKLSVPDAVRAMVLEGKKTEALRELRKLLTEESSTK
jgi:hypothetical protein